MLFCIDLVTGVDLVVAIVYFVAVDQTNDSFSFHRVW